MVIFFIILIACVLVYGWLNNWPWWLFLIGTAIVLTLWLGILFIRRYIARRREKLFVKRVIEEDERSLEAVPESRRLDFEELQKKWKEAISLLSSSHLKKKGNPLYVLPWFLFLGESGSGKTTALKNCRLASPLTDIPRVSGIAGTRNFDWWFFNEAIILDTAGRYSIPVDEVLDREEWEKFLVLVAKYRKKEPINGIVVTVSTDSLLKQDNTTLTDKGQYLRKRIDHVMRVTGHKIPVYILVTKLDLIHGMTPFASVLGERYFNQSLGYMGSDEQGEKWEDFLKNAFDYIATRLKRIRFLLVQQDREISPGLLVFPNEFSQLYPGLKAFCQGLLSPNPYQESPFLRGIYFSSAKQEGDLISEFLESFGLNKYSKINTSFREKGLFLKDIFSKILPHDRFLFVPLVEYQKWKRVTLGFALLTWIFFNIVVGGLIAGAFEHNLMIIKKAKEIGRVKIINNIGPDLIVLSKYGEDISLLQKQQNDYLLPQMGLSYAKGVVSSLRKKYILYFEKCILDRLDNNIFNSVREMNKGKELNEDFSIEVVDFITAQATILKNRIKGKSIDNKFFDDITYYSTYILPNLSGELAPYFGRCFKYYIMFSNNRDLKIKYEEILTQLRDFITTKGTQLHWIVKNPGLNKYNITLSSFWGNSPIQDSDQKEMFVSGAFTEKGRKELDNFINLLENLLKDEGIITKDIKINFYKWYEQEFFQKWYEFIEYFSQGQSNLISWDQRHNMAIKMCNEHNPYFDLIEVFSKEVKGALPHAKIRDWAIPVLMLAQAKKESYILSKEKEKQIGLKEKIKTKLEGSFIKLRATSSSLSDIKQAKEFEEVLRLAGEWTKYMHDLKQLQQVTDDSEAAFSLTSGFFPYGRKPEESRSPFYETFNEIYIIKNKLKKYGNSDTAILLLRGPFDYILDYSVMESACVLQRKWEEEVIGKLQGLSYMDKIKELFSGDQSLMAKFLQTTAKPFVGIDRYGYYPRQALGKKMPFLRGFFEFVNQGNNLKFSSKKEYYVTLKTLPISANKDAKIIPYGCKLSLQCADKIYQLENLNYPLEKTFKWSPDSCGDTVLAIYLPGLKLEKVYSGTMGFAKFLKKFRDGTGIFRAEDFPKNISFLKSNGLEWIKVSYEISNSGPIIQLLQKIPDEIPLEILQCWHE
ncbi:type VI secretion protein IcmF/TssM N-terminal domain-containing protein [Desulfothermus okinawensis JCM 13304]